MAVTSARPSEDYPMPNPVSVVYESDWSLSLQLHPSCRERDTKASRSFTFLVHPDVQSEQQDSTLGQIRLFGLRQGRKRITMSKRRVSFDIHIHIFIPLLRKQGGGGYVV